MHSNIITNVYRASQAKKTINYSDRKKRVPIDTIIMHYTEFDYKKSFETLAYGGNVSAHFLISENGEIDDLVPLNKKAWHAGESYWDGREAINDYSIGIEIVNAGLSGIDDCDLNKAPEYTKEQYIVLSELISYIKSKFPEIKDRYILGHSDITAYNLRKLDPGIQFNWYELYKMGHGIYHKVDLKDRKVIFTKGQKSSAILGLKEQLNDLGYKISKSEIFDQELANVICAFNMHFNQSELKINNFKGDTWSSCSNQILSTLIKKIKNIKGNF